MISTETKDGQRYLLINEHRFKLKTINILWLQRLEAEQEKKKPQPPVIEMKLGRSKETRLQENTGDPDYQKALSEWETRSAIYKMNIIMAWGIDETPPEDFSVYGLDLATLEEKKLAWLESFYGGEGFNENTIAQIMTIIMGQTEATQEGIQEAEARFPSAGDSDESLGQS